MKHFTKLFRSPAEAIAEAKRSPKMKDAIGMLVLAALLGAIASALALIQIGSVGAALGQLVLISAVSAFVLVLAGGLFLAYLLKLTANTLGGRGNWLHGIIAVSYGLPAPMLGVLVATILLRVPFVGAIIAFVIIAITLVLGASTFYRGAKEMFGMDMITTFVALSLLFGTLILSMTVGSALLGINLGGTIGLPAGTIPGI